MRSELTPASQLSLVGTKSDPLLYLLYSVQIPESLMLLCQTMFKYFKLMVDEQ